MIEIYSLIDYPKIDMNSITLYYKILIIAVLFLKSLEIEIFTNWLLNFDFIECVSVPGSRIKRSQNGKMQFDHFCHSKRRAEFI